MTLTIRQFAVTTLVCLTLVASGCASKGKKGTSSGSDDNISSTDQGSEDGDLNFELNADSDGGKAGAIATVFFDFNSASLTRDSKNTLRVNAKFLKRYKSVEVQIEGHCDERGGVQYNLALGERRAKSVRSFLSALGVSKRRISTVSFGKERPVAFGHNEESWGQNRRGNFVITAK